MDLDEQWWYYYKKEMYMEIVVIDTLILDIRRGKSELVITDFLTSLSKRNGSN